MREVGNWTSAFALFIYAAAFSFAYVDLAAGTGALLLFGAVQATMILWGFRKGERLDAIQVVGLVAAVSGLVVLVFPGWKFLARRSLCRTNQHNLSCPDTS